MTAATQLPLRVSFDRPTGRLLLSGPGWSGIGTLEESEERRRVIDAAIMRVRLDAYEGKWPTGFLKQIADL